MDEQDRRLLRRIDINVSALLRLAGGEAVGLAQLVAHAEHSEETMASLQQLTADLVAKVDPLEDAVEAGTTALNTLGAKVLELMEQIRLGGLTPELEAQLVSVGQAMTTGAGQIMSAVVANTPADPATP